MAESARSGGRGTRREPWGEGGAGPSTLVADLVCPVDVRAPVEQQPHDLEVAFLRRGNESRSPVNLRLDLDLVHVDPSAPRVARLAGKHGDGLIFDVHLYEVVHRGQDVAHEIVVDATRVVVPYLLTLLLR